MANKRIIELQERTSIDMGDWLIVDSSTSTRKLSLATLFNYMTYSSMIFVTELPTTDISTTTIYLVPHSGSTTDWDEYIYRDNEWIQIGTSTIDLSAIYQTKTDNNLQTTSKQIVGAINEVNSDLANKKISVTSIIVNQTMTNQVWQAHDYPAGTNMSDFDFIGVFVNYADSTFQQAMQMFKTSTYLSSNSSNPLALFKDWTKPLSDNASSILFQGAGGKFNTYTGQDFATIGPDLRINLVGIKLS